MDRTGGAGSNRGFLGYFKNNLELQDIDEVKWNVYSKVGTENYLQIYLRGGILNLQTATVIFEPVVTLNEWQENSLTTASSITVRVPRILLPDLVTTYTTSGTTAFDQLMAYTYKNWDLRVDTTARA